MTTAANPLAGAAGDEVTGEAIALPNMTGLHARPAALLVAVAKKFKSEIRLVRGSEEVNAKSVVAILGLGTQQGDLLRVRARGEDAAQAVGAVSEMLREGCGEQSPIEAKAGAETPPDPRGAPQKSAHALTGVCASAGLAVGRVVQYRPDDIVVAAVAGTVAREHSKLEAALEQARAQITALKLQLGDLTGTQVLDAHLELLVDPGLIDLALSGLARGESAGQAWRAAFQQMSARVEGLEGAHNALLRERGNDIRDVGRRVLSLLAGVTPARIELPDAAVLVAEELTPSDTAALDRSRLVGICTTRGGATSHVAILARSFGIPLLCGVEQDALSLADGTLVVLDADQGVLRHRPSGEDLSRAKELVAHRAARSARERACANEAAVTSDGVHIEVVANVRNEHEASEAMALGGEGVGLLRSEFLFDDRHTAPDEEEQAAAYAAVAKAVGPRSKLVIRTLDVGGDKPLSYLPLPAESNPFLGLRGLRVSLGHPQMFRTQLRAILRCAGQARLHVMFPMISMLEELREAKAILAQEVAAAGHPDVKVGIMIEVPSAALLAESLAREVDFFSIGSNDLTQYTLAMDRGHPQLAPKLDGLHPAVLKMIALSCEGAARHGKWVGVCGGLASDPIAVPALIGLGVHELSAPAPALPAIKAVVRQLCVADCRSMAQQLLQLGTAGEVRARLAAFAS